MPASSSFPDSYYNATRSSSVTYPRLVGAHSCDVAIIGGGFSGIVTALLLAERQQRVLVVEAKRIGWGASGRNGGLLVGGFANPARLLRQLRASESKLVAELYFRGNDLVKRYINQYNIQCDYQSGHIEVACNSAQARSLWHEYQWLVANGHAATVYFHNQAAIRRIITSNRYVAGLEYRQNGHLHPLNLCLSEAQQAVKFGAELFENSKADKVIPATSKLPAQVIGEKFRIKAEAIVIAGNAHHLLTNGGLHNAVMPVRSYIGVSKPDEVFAKQRLIAKHLAVNDCNNITDYYRITADNRLLFGAGCGYLNISKPDLAKFISKRISRIFPQLAGLKLDYVWDGQIAVTLNRIPMLGRLPGNLYFMQGYSGHGISTSHLFAQLLVAAIMGKDDNFDSFAKLKHLAIPGARAFGSPVLALAMLYYKLADLL